jgi:acid phosphatase family membrane protein YuiD
VTGFGSMIFVVTLAFSVVIKFDASTVRRAAGLQARLLNQIIDGVLIVRPAHRKTEGDPRLHRGGSLRGNAGGNRRRHR